MRKEMVIRLHTSSDKGNSKAIKVAAAITGVESVTIAGEDKNLLLVIGVGIDSNHITEKLRRKVGHAEVVELRTVDADELAARELAGERARAYRYHPSPSPYNHGGAYYSGGRYVPQAMAAGGGAARERYYAGGGSSYGPATAVAGARDYYYYDGTGAGAGGYPGQYQQQRDVYYPAAASSTHTVVHHEYANDPNSCSIM